VVGIPSLFFSFLSFLKGKKKAAVCSLACFCFVQEAREEAI